MADALLERAVKQGQALVWEYYFPFGGGPSRWTSGFAQAVAADALYRAGLLLHDDRLTAAAHAAFVGLTAGLTRPVEGGRWVVEYSNSDMLVLNAHLESLLALQRYAKGSGDPDVVALAQQFNHAAHALLPSFDTGCWSRYSLNGQPASPGYHSYHVQLLRRLYATTHDPLWQQSAGTAISAPRPAEIEMTTSVSDDDIVSTSRLGAATPPGVATPRRLKRASDLSSEERCDCRLSDSSSPGLLARRLPRW